jgi:DNA-binding NarL/FixJ family response regulator
VILTFRQRQLAELVSQGLSNKEIAARLHLDAGTIKVYLFHMFRKLKVGNRVQLALYWIRERACIAS